MPHPTLTPHPTLVPPPTALLHPTLLEKLRLGTPTMAHVDLSTLNHHQTENEINNTFYELEKTSPFPKLPVYFVHKSTAGGADGGEGRGHVGDGGILKDPQCDGMSPGSTAGHMTHRRSSGNVDVGSPAIVGQSVSTSGKRRVSRTSTGSGCEEAELASSQGGVEVSSERCGSGRREKQRACVTPQWEELPTRAWHIPQDDDA